jgi:thiol-disulfide isomerase/thioredoxin
MTKFKSIRWVISLHSVPIYVAAVLSAGVGLISGCTTDGYPTDNTYHVQGKAPSSVPPPSTFAYRYPDAPPLIDANGLRKLVDQYRHRVVLLDFWATWSQTNREEMAMLARLQDELHDEGFQVIACSLDDQEKWSQVIVPILHDAHARFPCVMVPEHNRTAVRAWLAPTWTYDIPARFVMNTQGDVVISAGSDTPLASVEQQVRELVLHGRAPADRQGSIVSTASAHGKMINVSTGSYESLRDTNYLEDSQNKMAERLADQIAGKLDASANPRIAILPFPQRAGQREPDAYGEKTAKLVEQALRERGFTNLVPPAQTQRLIKQAGLTANTIEFQPEAAKDVLDCDYIVIGWSRTASSPKATETGQREKPPAAKADEDRPAPSRVLLDEPSEDGDAPAKSQVKRPTHDDDE